MNRRSFLRAFTGGVVGAGVLAYAPSKSVTVFEGDHSLYFADKIHPTMKSLERFREIIWAGTTDVRFDDEGRATLRRYYYNNFPS